MFGKEAEEIEKEAIASIARVFGYTRENIRQICADNEE